MSFSCVTLIAGSVLQLAALNGPLPASWEAAWTGAAGSQGAVDPRDRRTLEASFDALLVAGRLDDAQKLLESAAKRGAGVGALHGRMKHRLSVAKARSGDEATALAELEQAARLLPSDPTVIWDLLVVRSWAGLHWEAVETFESLPRPEEAAGYVRREAAEAYRAIHRPADALRLYASLVERDAPDPELLGRMRSLLVEDSRRCFEPGLQRLARPGSVRPAWLAGHRWARELHARAVEAAGRGDLASARRALKSTLSLPPPESGDVSDWLVLLHLSGCHAEVGELARALPEPDRARLAPQVGASLASTGSSDAALEIAERACAAARKHAGACADQVHRLLALGRHADAEKLVARLRGPNPQRLQADVHLFQGRLDASEELYKAALQRTEPEPEAELGLATVLALRARHEEAARHADSALARLSFEDHLLHHALSPAASLALAEVLNGLGRHREAIAALQIALAAAPDSVPALTLLAQALSGSAQRLEALAVYNRILRLDPGLQSAAEGRARLLLRLQALTPARAEAERLASPELQRQARALADVQGWELQGTAPVRDGSAARVSLEERARAVLAALRWSEENGEAADELLLRSAAEASVELDDDQRALALYRKLHARQVERGLGDSEEGVDVQLEQVRCLTRLRNYSEAWSLLDALDARVPERREINGAEQPNWSKGAIAVERGWVLIAQDRFGEAERHFESLLAAAPRSAAARSGLAHTRLVRGWQRQAQSDLELAASLHPDDVEIRVGLAEALRLNRDAARAETLAAELSRVRPDDRHVRDLHRRLALDRRPELTAEGGGDTQAVGIGGRSVGAQLRVPVAWGLSMTGGYRWRREGTGSLGGFAAQRHRAALGAQFEWTRDLTLGAQGFVDPATGKLGAAAEARYAPTDRLSAEARVDLDAWSLPPGAVRALKSGREGEASITYRHDESLFALARLGLLSMSDGNLLPRLGAEGGLRLYTNGAWTASAALEGTVGGATGLQQSYYAPLLLWSGVLAPEVTHVWTSSRTYGLQDRLQLQGGVLGEYGHGHSELLGVTYSQTHTFFDVADVVLDAGLTRRSYEGTPELNWRLSLGTRLRF